MRLTKTLLAAAVATTFAGAAMAGGFSDEIVEAPVVVIPTDPAPSLPVWVIPAVLVAGLVALAASNEDS